MIDATMTDAFMGYKENFDQCCEEANMDIRAIADATTNAAREDAIACSETSVAEAERYLRILESESQLGDAQTRQMMQQMVRSCKLTVDKLKSLLERNKLVADSQQRLNERPKDMSTKEQMAHYNTRLDGAGDLLDDAKKLVADSETVAQNTTTNLLHQRRQIDGVNTNLVETRGDAAQANTHLTSLNRKGLWKIVSLYLIIVVLTAHIIYRLVKKFTTTERELVG